MIDSFVLLAPILLLGVIALAGFVGCATLAGIDDWSPQGGPTSPWAWTASNQRSQYCR